MGKLETYDNWLSPAEGPAALAIREHLIPAEGPDGVVFPATFAAGDGFKGGYNIDSFNDGSNVCLIDSVGSQANRIEPTFMQNGYKKLVPQVVVEAGEKRVNLLEVGHRAGDVGEADAVGLGEAAVPQPLGVARRHRPQDRPSVGRAPELAVDSHPSAPGPRAGHHRHRPAGLGEEVGDVVGVEGGGGIRRRPRRDGGSGGRRALGGCRLGAVHAHRGRKNTDPASRQLRSRSGRARDRTLDGR